MNDNQYNKRKNEILKSSKNNGLDLWEKVFSNYGLDIEKAKTTGVFVPNIGHIILYFDESKQQWLCKPVCPIKN